MIDDTRKPPFVGEPRGAEEPEEAEGEELEEQEVEEEPKPNNDLAYLFEVPQANDNDIYSDDLVELYEEDVMGGDLDDLTRVTNEDIMGRPMTKRKTRKVARTRKLYPPPSGMQGLRQ